MTQMQRPTIDDIANVIDNIILPNLDGSLARLSAEQLIFKMECTRDVLKAIVKECRMPSVTLTKDED